MKISSIITSAKFVCAASLLTLSFGASAATTWAVSDFRDGTNATTATAKNISAWSTTGTSSTFAVACLRDYASSGWGIVNTAEDTDTSSACNAATGPHAADNAGQIDLFLLQFDSAVSLSQINIGWNGTDYKVGNSYKDSDISILAYTGTSPTTATVSGLTTSNLTNAANGWTSIGNYANVGASNNTGTTKVFGGSTVVTTTISSSWWLVSAYSNKYDNSIAFDTKSDYFKLLSVAGTVDTKTNETPEPGSLALAALGLLGIVGLRRRAAVR